MEERISKLSPQTAIIFFCAVVVFAFTPGQAFAWGANAQKIVVNKAVDTLPPDVRVFFDANRAFLVLHVNDPLDAEAKLPSPSMVSRSWNPPACCPGKSASTTQSSPRR
jgi:hypothetical protein